MCNDIKQDEDGILAVTIKDIHYGNSDNAWCLKAGSTGRTLVHPVSFCFDLDIKPKDRFRIVYLNPKDLQRLEPIGDEEYDIRVVVNEEIRIHDGKWTIQRGTTGTTFNGEFGLMVNLDKYPPLGRPDVYVKRSSLSRLDVLIPDENDSNKGYCGG